MTVQELIDKLKLIQNPDRIQVLFLCEHCAMPKHVTDMQDFRFGVERLFEDDNPPQR